MRIFSESELQHKKIGTEKFFRVGKTVSKIWCRKVKKQAYKKFGIRESFRRQKIWCWRKFRSQKNSIRNMESEKSFKVGKIVSIKNQVSKNNYF